MRSRFTDYRLFITEFRRTFQSTGAVMPSGGRLCNALAHFVRNPLISKNAKDISDKPRRILEVGPGTGAVTVAIASAMRPGDTLHMVELNEPFVVRLKERLASDPLLMPIASQTELFHSDLRELPQDAPYDVIISGLPLNNFPVSLVQELLAALQKLSAPNGTLSFFEYIAIRKFKASISRSAERTRLREIDSILSRILADHEIRRDRILPNVPPAWVHHVCFSKS